MSNRRIWYATQAVGAAPLNSTTYTPMHGVQIGGLATNYTLQPIMELSQATIYELKELIPEVTVSLEKVLDGYPLLYHLCTQGAVDGSLVGRSAQQAMIAYSIYPDTFSSASGTPTSQIECSGMWWNELSYTFPLDRPFMENLSLIGNNRVNKTGAADFTPTFTNVDAPLALAGSGGVQIRQDLIFYPILGGVGYAGGLENGSTLDVNGQVIAFYTILPANINGISTSGTNVYTPSSDSFNCHVQSISVSVNAGRDAVYELGHRFPYYRFMNFPIAVTTEITIIATDLDTLTATEAGLDGQGDNSLYQTIKVRSKEGTWIDLGTNNKCQSVSFGGGNADGGNATLTYSYINYDQMLVSHPQDPSIGQGNIRWPY